MVLDSNREDTSAFKINGQEIEEVDDFIYLGSTITNKGNSALEIRRRLAMAREAVSKMGNTWRSRRVSLNLKLRVLWATAFPIAIYGSESCTMQKAVERRVDAFEMWCYRRVLKIPWTERKTNAWVLDKIGNRLCFFGHVIRRKGTRKNDHHREGQRKEKERPSPNIMAQGHQEPYRDDTARGCEEQQRIGRDGEES